MKNSIFVQLLILVVKKERNIKREREENKIRGKSEACPIADWCCINSVLGPTTTSNKTPRDALCFCIELLGLAWKKENKQMAKKNK